MKDYVRSSSLSLARMRSSHCVRDFTVCPDVEVCGGCGKLGVIVFGGVTFFLGDVDMVLRLPCSDRTDASTEISAIGAQS